MTSPFVTQLDLAVGDRLRTDLLSQGFALSEPTYTVFAARKPGVSCTLYTSGKLVVQGKKMAEFIEFYLEPEILGHLAFTNPEIDLTPRIGCDEAGKGDFFGPLCIAGVYADAAQIQTLQEMGVADSKRLSDARAHTLAKNIRGLVKHHVITLRPEKYNELYDKFRNLNNLLAWGHATVIENLAEETGAQEAVVDQFAKNGVLDRALSKKTVSVTLTQEVRAESAYLVVAAASILARDAFVKGLDALSDAYGMTLPKGAGSPVPPAGRQFILRQGRESLGKVAKLHFKTAAQL